jgi:hypothetical protein
VACFYFKRNLCFKLEFKITFVFDRTSNFYRKALVKLAFQNIPNWAKFIKMVLREATPNIPITTAPTKILR